MKVAVQPILARLDPLIAKSRKLAETGTLIKAEGDQQSQGLSRSPSVQLAWSSTGPDRMISDLEPSLEVLQLLRSESSITHLLDFTLPTGSDPLASLFSFELDIPKPRPAEPTPPPRPTTPQPILEEQHPVSEPEPEYEYGHGRGHSHEPPAGSTSSLRASPDHEQALTDEQVAVARKAAEYRRNLRTMWQEWDTRGVLEDVNLAPGVRAKTRNARKAALAFEAEAIASGGSVEGDTASASGRDVTMADTATSTHGEADHQSDADEPAPDTVDVEEQPAKPLTSRSKKSGRKSKRPRTPPEPLLMEDTAEPQQEAMEVEMHEEVGEEIEPQPAAPIRRTRSTKDVPMADVEVPEEAQEAGSSRSKRQGDRNRRKASKPRKLPETDDGAVSGGESAGSPPKAESPRSRKRKRTSEVEDPIGPILVEDVAPHDSFLLFNKGWVLPEGSRRRSKDTRPVAPLPKSRKGERALFPPSIACSSLFLISPQVSQSWRQSSP